MWLGGVFWLVLIVGGIGLIVSTVNRGPRGGDAAPRRTEDQALGLLRERFARGDIGEDEYWERRAILERDV